MVLINGDLVGATVQLANGTTRVLKKKYVAYVGYTCYIAEGGECAFQLHEEQPSVKPGDIVKVIKHAKA